MTQSIRSRLFLVTGVGVITAAISLFALVHILSVTTAQRIERAEEVVRDALHTLSRVEASQGVPPSSIVGLRAGFLVPGAAPEDVPPEWRALLRTLEAQARASGAPEVSTEALEDATLVLAVEPKGSVLAWAGYTVRPPTYLRMWQMVVAILAVATVVLVAGASITMINVKRGATGLSSALVALANDLSAPIPRPNMQELGEVAAGIAELARRLAESRGAEVRLQRELAERERLAALGRVVAGVAHEVRNPLASIKLRLDLTAASTPPLPDAVLDAIASASAEIQRLDRLVADLLMVGGRAVGPPRAVDLDALVHSRMEALGPWAAERGVSLRDPARRLISVLVDPDSTTRAIDNLLRNAVEASPAGGVVEVSIQADAAGVRVRVDDQGAGVAGARAAELFEPFFSTKSGGTGLGLAISRAIARAHGGDISYRREGGRTRFEMQLGPAVLVAGDPRPQASQEPQGVRA